MNFSFSSGETRMQKWLMRDCARNHPACRLPEPAFLPNRLIDLRKYPNVCLSQSLVLDSSQDQRYVALSYCWGPSMPERGKTTAGSLEENLRSIDVQQLPETISDAIEFTYRIGVPFLWVDALCIIQDDKSDWKHEAALMSSIYTMAFVTLAAASSSDCQEGFLKTLYTEAEIQMPRAGRRGGGMEDFQATMTFGRDFSSLWLRSFLNNPLFSRGWTLQERELSPRIIHFTRHFVIWECRHRVCAYLRPRQSWVLFEPKMHEIYRIPGVSWPYRCFDVPNSDSGLDFNPMQRVSHWDSSSISFGTWQKLVEDFSNRQLTVASDKIPAISGIAEALKNVFKCEFVAGLWRDNILRELLWYRASKQTTHTELDPSTHYAPSWSWARTNFSILFFSSADFDDAEIVQVAVTQDGAEDEEYSGSITLRARVLDLSIRAGANVILDIGKQYGCNTNIYPNSSEEENFTFCILQTCKAIPDRWTGGGMMRGTEIPHRKIPGTPACGAGLALRKVDGELSTYRRVGFVDLVPLEYFDSLERQELTIV